jgi:uncharacterized protein (DUF983 family)
MNDDDEPVAAGAVPRMRPVLRAAALACPRCGRGRLFERFFGRGFFRMRPACDQCGLAFTREPGFYLGSIYINYGATVLLTGGLYAVLVLLAGWSADAALTACLAVAVAFPILFFRHARSFLLALDATVNRQQSQPDGGGDAGSLTGDQLASLTSDDARAGCLMGFVLVLIILFGLGMAAATLFFMQPMGDGEASSEAVDLR